MKNNKVLCRLLSFEFFEHSIRNSTAKCYLFLGISINALIILIKKLHLNNPGFFYFIQF